MSSQIGSLNLGVGMIISPLSAKRYLMMHMDSPSCWLTTCDAHSVQHTTTLGNPRPSASE